MSRRPIRARFIAPVMSALIVASALASSAAPAPGISGLTAEFPVNATTANNQDSPVVAVDQKGNSYVVWRSTSQDGSGFGLFGRRFDPAGVPTTAEFPINTFTTSDQQLAAIAMGKKTFSVVWQDASQDGSSTGIFGRSFDTKTATPVTPEFPVPETTTGFQSEPAVAAGKSDIVATWASNDASALGVFARRLSPTGSPQTGEVQLNSYTTGDQRNPSVVVGKGNDFIATWDSTGPDGSGSGVVARKFNSNGNPLTPEVQVNAYTTSTQAGGSAIVDKKGNFVVTWVSVGQDGSGAGVFARKFDPDGLPITAEVQVNEYTLFDQRVPVVAMEKAGSFLVAWEGWEPSSSSPGVFVRRFDANVVPLTSEFQVNTFTTSTQGGPSVASDKSGNFVVTWTSFGQDGNGFGVFARRFAP